jgi:hypothetical protein
MANAKVKEIEREPLYLKKNAPVMLILNLSAKLVNGLD